MKALIPFTVACSVLIVGLICLYFVSPSYQIASLQSENYQLKSQLAELKAEATENIVALVIIGMLSLCVILMTGFFLMLCLLSGKTPAEFFSVRKYHAIPADSRPEIEHKPTEKNYYPVKDDRYAVMMEVF